MLIQAGFSHRPRGLQIILDHICQACLKLLKIFIGKQVTKRYYYSKEITLSEGILGSILWNSQLYVQIPYQGYHCASDRKTAAHREHIHCETL